MFFLEKIFFPKTCFGCRQLILDQSEILCAECLQQVTVINQPSCKSCGGVNDTVLDVCNECISIPIKYWDDGYSMWEYSGIIRKLIHRYKYRSCFEIQALFHLGLVTAINRKVNLDEIDFIIWIPMHFIKRVLRGYNQTEILAKELAEKLGKPCLSCITRSKFTRSQVSLDRASRYKNMKNVFAVKQNSLTSVKQARILVLDDVLTTGATLNSVSRVLKESGAKSVTVLSIARGR